MLHMKVVKRVNPKSSHHKEKILLCYFFNFVSIWDDECPLNVLWSSFHDISQTIMLYTLNSYSAQSLSCVRLCDPMGHQTALSMAFPRQEYSSGSPCPPSGDFPDKGIESHLLHLLHWQKNSLPLHHLGSP